MVAIQGLGGIPEPKPEGPGRVRRDRDDEAREAAVGSGATAGKDGVSISDAAKQAAEVARIVQLSKNAGETRVERVEAARERIARGDYKNPEVVARVAERLLKFLG
jgi:anti-sigma28 factor (negative regulator of flagellin synthesis)